MSSDRFRVLRRAASLVVLVAGAATVAQSCGFPEHTFIDDDLFNSGGQGGGSGGTDASVPGSGGVAPQTGGTTGSTGGEHVVVPHEAGVAPRSDGSAGGQPSVLPDAGDAGGEDGSPGCPIGTNDCGGTCVDLLTSLQHCGKCETACTGTEVCSAGTCSVGCANGLTSCTPTGQPTNICVNTDNDENHCGKCNTPCKPGFVCSGGACVVDCGTLTRCGSSCFNTMTDSTHCGSCTTPCQANYVCSGGTCKPNCTTPFVACGDTCVNFATDDKNCGGCNKPCLANQACVGSTCTTLVENCQNGIDDDRDGKADCADTDCAPKYTCASQPAGWQGPVAIWAGTTGAAPACPAAAGFPSVFLTANAGLVVPPSTCPDCKCTPNGAITCDDLSFKLDDSTTCTSSNGYWDGLTVPVNGACQDWLLCEANPTAQSAALQGKASDYVHGTCSATQGTPQFSGTSWTSEVRGCGASPGNAVGGGCSVGQCFPKPVAPYGTSLCIFRAGIASCPVDYPVQRPGTSQQYYQSVLEGRSCSSCSCDAKCDGTVNVYTTSDCSGTGTPLKFGTGDTCTQIPGDSTQSLASTGQCPAKRDTRSFQWTGAAGVCGSSTSTLSGAPTPESPVTVCCQSP